MALFQRAPRALARIAVVAVAAVAVTSTGLGGVARAGTPTVTTGAAVLNDGPHTITVSAPGNYLPGNTAAMTLTSPVAGDPVLEATDVAVALDGHTITGTFDYTLANPGGYDLEVFQTPASPSPTDTCSACVSVNGLKPTVSAVSPSVLAGGTTGGGYQDFVITGQSFARGLYTQCTTTPCTAGLPQIAVYETGTANLDANVTLTQTVNPSDGTTPAPTSPTATSITLRIEVDNTTTAAYADDIVVINSDGKTGTCTGCLTIEPRPTITSALLQATGQPSIGQSATGQTVVITGDHFPSDSTVSFNPPNDTSGSITYTDVSGPTDVDGHQVLTVTGVSTTGVTTTGNLWTVSVSSAAKHATSDATVFAVNPRPVATGVTYLDGTAAGYGQGATAVRLQVAVGSAFTAGEDPALHTRVAFTGLPAGVTITGQTATVGTPNSVTVSMDVAPGTTVGSYGLKVVNPDGGTSDTCDNSVVLPPEPNTCVLTLTTGPTITSLAPSTMTGTGSNQQLVINGTGFHTSGTTVVVGPAGAPYFSGDVTPGSTTTITIPNVVVPSDETAKDVDVKVINTDDKGTVTTANGLHIANLSVTSASPASGTNDAPAAVQVNGTHLSPTATVRLVRPGSTLTATGVVDASSGAGTALTGTFDLTGASPGAYDVVVTNPAEDTYPGTASCTGCFTVLAPAPAVTTVSPSTVGGGAPDVSVTITGTSFFPGATVSFSDSHVHLVGDPVVTATTITQHISVDATATTAAGTVTVTNTDGQSAAKAFSTTAAPTVTSISPTAKAAGTTFTMTVTGTGIGSGATLSFDVAGISAANYAVNGGGTQLTAEVTVAGSVATTGPVTAGVTLVNPDQGRASAPTGLTVSPQPTVSGLTPDHPAAGSSSTLHVLGAHFQSGATLVPQGAGTGLTVTNVQWVSATELTATLAVDAAAAAGQRQLAVTNPDGGTVLAELFVVTVPSAPTGVTATPGVRQVTVAWAAPASDGGSAVTSYTVTLTPQGATVPAASFTSNDASTLSHDFTTDLLDGTQYNAAVVATNSAGNSPKASASATTFSLPGAPTSPAATAGVREVQVSWAAPASNGGTAVTSYTVTLTPASGTALTFTTPDATVLDHTFTGLANATSYTAGIVATNAVGDSPSASTSSVTTKGVPTAPQGLSATGGIREIGVTWTAPASDGGTPVSSYTATVTNQANPADTASITTPDATTLSHTFTGLANGATYTVTVKATNAAGPSAAASGAATTTGLPGAPATVTATGGVRQVDVSWTAPAADGGRPVTSYTVSLQGPSGGSSQVLPGTATSHTFASLANGTSYTASVVATTAVGDGPAATATASTFGVPATPVVTATAGDRRVTVSWTVSSDGGTPITGYQVVADPGGAVVATTGTTATFTGLTNGTAYTFTVTATNTAGSSSATSAPVTPWGTSTVSFGSLPKVVTYGTPITFAGRVNRTDASVAPGTVSVRFRVDSGAVGTLRTLATDSTGAFGFRFTPSKNATYVLVYNGDAHNLTGASVARRTLVAPRITVSAPSGAYTSPQVVTGSVRPLKAGSRLSLYRLRSDGALVRLQTVTLSSTSTYRFAVRLPRGRTRLVIIMPATPGNANSKVLFTATRT